MEQVFSVVVRRKFWWACV